MSAQTTVRGMRFAAGAWLVWLMAPASSLAESYKVDPVHSFVLFRIKHMGIGQAYGRFNQSSGTFSIDESDPAKCAIDVTVKAESVDTGNAKRDSHLKSPDFFNAKEFPTIKFKSKTFTKTGERMYDVEGELTLHGVTKPIAVKVEHIGTANDKAGIEATFTVKRSEFGMTFGLDNGSLGDEVTVRVGLEGGK